MSKNLDSYIESLQSSKRLNAETAVAADLMVGAYRRRGIGQGSGPAGSGTRIPLPPPPNGYCPPVPHGALPLGTPVTGPCPPEFLCDCDLIGGTSLGTAPQAAGTTVTVTIGSFDAVALQPVALWFTAFEAAAAGPPVDLVQIASPVIEIPVLMTDADIGNQGQLRQTGGITTGLNSGAFAATREPVCVDWGRFTSTPGQELTMQFNLITATANPMHVFAVLWCNVLQ